VRLTPRHLVIELASGLQGAISSFPGGMATAVLAGVNPVQGLYACVAGAVRRRPDRAHPAHDHHNHERGGAGGRAGPAHNAEAPRRPAAMALLA